MRYLSSVLSLYAHHVLRGPLVTVSVVAIVLVVAVVLSIVGWYCYRSVVIFRIYVPHIYTSLLSNNVPHIINNIRVILYIHIHIVKKRKLHLFKDVYFSVKSKI